MPTSNEGPAAGGADEEFDRGWEGHRRRQAALGLDLTPVERLRWLEESMEYLRSILGRAREGRPVGPGRRGGPGYEAGAPGVATSS